jgi:hypothetical protein
VTGKTIAAAVPMLENWAVPIVTVPDGLIDSEK